MMEKTCKSYGYYVNSNNMYMIIILVVYFTDNLRGVQISNIFNTNMTCDFRFTKKTLGYNLKPKIC